MLITDPAVGDLTGIFITSTFSCFKGCFDERKTLLAWNLNITLVNTTDYLNIVEYSQ